MPKFGKQSLASRAQLHPLLQRIVDEAIKETDFKILDALRGKAAQERALREGHSKVKFGQSAHNYIPAVAMDLFPAPYDWDNVAAFKYLQLAVILPIAKRLKIPIRQGIDWNGDGNLSDGWDKPHVELTPWRTWAKKDCKLYIED